MYEQRFTCRDRANGGTGHGDVVRDTLLPLGYHLRLHPPPERLAVSGLKYPSAFSPLQGVTRLCASEHSRVEGGGEACWKHGRCIGPTVAPECQPRPHSTSESGLLSSAGEEMPRCATACHEAVHACWTEASSQTLPPRGWAHQAMQRLAELNRLPILPPHTWYVPAAAARDTGMILEVVIAHRLGRRRVLNALQLRDACSAQPDWRCRLVNFDGLSWWQTAQEMANAHVYVSMHGGTVINALHMRAGSLVIEMVNRGFEKARTGRPAC